MRIITWNCNMAFRKKWGAVLQFQPDILIIQECEQESKYKEAQLIPGYNEFIWVGENINKGVGILSFNNYHIQLSEVYSKKYKYILPIEVSGEKDFHLFAIWAMPNKNRAKGYVGQIWNALKYYKTYLDENTVLAGDWNSNAIWDQTRKKGNHTDVVKLLDQLGIVSVYHELKNEAHGKEAEPTLYLLRKEHKPYHLDYCFVPKKWINEKTKITVGKFEDWIGISDHMPVIINGLR